MSVTIPVPRDLPDPQTEPTLSIERAAAILGISRRSGYELAEAGDLPTIAVGKRRRQVPTWRFLAKFDLVAEQPPAVGQ